ncbi:medium-chain fatty acid-CoA ligase FAA2 [Sugiyamaella lignohabitans]|uniref:Medium-chain fatty acid-CoA ligase FAA2 n=1 Tax=Sugiyamaella lignohabitans TaxID=796027 RepID=A0A167EXH1_9ASCO|nr:medium-chain fatty acid-CoA ligase FAA2 [Sugiyamaella lignohabitans]ANB14573.1 medium-chain fatty acid-CoA ligase FAA2 [Sugiyamaella lignohabitans]
MASQNENGFTEETLRRIWKYNFVLPDGINENTSPFDTTLSSHAAQGKPQALPVPGTKQPGYSEIYRNQCSPDKVISGYHPSVKTFYDAFLTVATTYPKRDCIADREYDQKLKKWGNYKWLSFEETAKRRTKIAAGLVHAVRKATGFDPADKKYIVSVYAPNCVNWILTDLACQTQSLPTVCLYDTLGPHTSEYILNLCESPIVVCSLANVPRILSLKHKLPHVKVIVSTNSFESVPGQFEPAGQSKKELLNVWANDQGVALYSLNEIEALGADFPIADRPPKPEDIYAINFTSGTTGNPKGAILTHANVVAAIAMGRHCLGKNFKPDQVATVYSFLPLAHIYERIAMCIIMSLGHRQAYPHGPVTEIFEDIQILKPTNVNMVPRVLNRVAAALRASTIEAPGLAGAISRKAHEAKLNHLYATGSPNHPIWDFLWSRKIRKKLGFDNLNSLVSGSAPLSKATVEFLKVALAAELLQGYGLTESMSGISVSQPEEPLAGSCGAVAPTTELRFRDVPELGYTANDKPFPRGEIMLRGPQMFTGYYKNNEKTLEAFDEDGWFHTGDVGTVDKLGRIFIIDRVKNFFKLSQGEYVAAEKIENTYLANSSLITQIFVHGDSTESYLVAIAGINPDSYATLANKVLHKRIRPTDLAALAATYDVPEVKAAFIKALNGSTGNLLQGFEKIKNVLLRFEPLTPENDTLTPTLKIKRPAAVKLFKAEIDAMYKEGPLSDSGALNSTPKL